MKTNNDDYVEVANMYGVNPVLGGILNDVGGSMNEIGSSMASPLKRYVTFASMVEAATFIADGDESGVAYLKSSPHVVASETNSHNETHATNVFGKPISDVNVELAANVANEGGSEINFCSLRNEEKVVNSDVVLPKHARDEVMSRYENTLIGYFVGEVTKVLVWVKLHGVPILAYLDVGLSLIATQIGKPIIAESVLKNEVVMAILDEEGDGNSREVIRVEYEWKPPHCVECKYFWHESITCPKHVKEASPRDPIRESKSASVKEHEDGFVQVKIRKIRRKIGQGSGINLSKTNPNFQFCPVSQPGKDDVNVSLKNSFANRMEEENALDECLGGGDVSGFVNTDGKDKGVNDRTKEVNEEAECFDPGGDNDEIDAFLAIKVPTYIEKGYYDSEGDVLYLESLLSDDTTHNLSPEVFFDHEPQHIENESDHDTFSPKSDPLHHEFAGSVITIPPRIDREHKDYISRMSEEIDIFSGPDDSIPPGIESDFDSEEDIIDNLLNDDPIPEYERLTFDMEPDVPMINNVVSLMEDGNVLTRGR
ncbi:hypothetical protein Tco_0741547 [Tanacetum coccineum]